MATGRGGGQEALEESMDVCPPLLIFCNEHTGPCVGIVPEDPDPYRRSTVQQWQTQELTYYKRSRARFYSPWYLVWESLAEADKLPLGTWIPGIG
jgi:hypothetical protein